MQKFLVEEADERIALIRVFQHPWVLYFQQKFFANWQPNDSEDEEEGADDESNSSSDEYYSDEEENEDEQD